MEQAAAGGDSSATRKAVISLLLGMFVVGIGNAFVFSVLPPVGREIGLSDVQIGSIPAIGALVFVFMTRYWGAKSELWGRRPVLLFAITSFFVMSMIFTGVVQLGILGIITIAVAYPLMVISRVLFTGCISGIVPTAQAYISDITAVEQRAKGMAVISMAMNLGVIVGPAVAAAFIGFGLAAPFFAVAAMSIVPGILFWIYVFEPPKHTHHSSDPSAPLAFMVAAPFYAIGALTICSISMVQQASGFYYQDKFVLTPEETAWSVGIGLMALACASLMTQIIFVVRFHMPPKKLLRIGVFALLTSTAVLISADSQAILWVGMGIFGVGFGMINPGNVAALSIHAQGHGFGKIAGNNASASSFGFALGPMLGSALYQEIHPLAPFYVASCLVIIMLILVYFVAKMPST